MTRKLAVTVFAMSLALAGCGGGGLSDVNGGKDATALTPDSRAADAAKPVDGVPAPGPEAGQPDVPRVPVIGVLDIFSDTVAYEVFKDERTGPHRMGLGPFLTV